MSSSSSSSPVTLWQPRTLQPAGPVLQVDLRKSSALDCCHGPLAVDEPGGLGQPGSTWDPRRYRLVYRLVAFTNLANWGAPHPVVSYIYLLALDPFFPSQLFIRGLVITPEPCGTLFDLCPHSIPLLPPVLKPLIRVILRQL